jgi:hypothetical protein
MTRESDTQDRESDTQDPEFDTQDIGLHGAYLRSQLVDAIGLPAVRSLVRAGRLVAFSRQVLINRHRTLDLLTRATAALLTAGPKAVLTSHTAALIHGCSAADSGVIHLLAGYDQQLRRRPDLRLHQGSFDQQDVVVRTGLRVLVLEAVIAELLCTASRSTALACADQAMGAVDHQFRGEFRAEVEHRIRVRPDPRGRRRAGVLLDLVTGLAESPAESRMLLVLFDAGLPVPESQYPVCDIHGRERYRLDFAWPEAMVALEYDGYAAHAERGDVDEMRDMDLRRRGWTVIRAGVADLREPGRVLRAVAAALGRRVARTSNSAS